MQERTLKKLHVTTRAAWRVWLEKHHARETEVWLIFYKQHTGKPRVPYDDAVEEALCFGWIDSIVRRIDDDCYMQKFTPRKANSKWSDSNRARVKKLLKAGLMTEAGKAVLEEKQKAENRKQTPHSPPVNGGKAEVAADVRRAVKANKRAAEYFNTLPPGYLRTCMKWIDDAKKSETRVKRITDFVRLCAEGKRIGMK